MYVGRILIANKVFMTLQIFLRNDGSLDQIIEINTTLVQMQRVGEVKSIFRFRIYLL